VGTAVWWVAHFSRNLSEEFVKAAMTGANLDPFSTMGVRAPRRSKDETK